MDYNSTVNVLAEAGKLMAYVSALTIGSMQVLKPLFFPKQDALSKRKLAQFMPATTLVVSTGLAFLFIGSFNAITVLIGIVSGLISMGLFTGTKVSVGK